MQRKISVEATRIPLGEALLTIARTADFNIAYNSEVLPGDSLITFRFENISVQEILSFILPHYVKLSINSNNVVLMKISPTKIPEKSLTILGRIVDMKTGAPVSGVRVHDVLMDVTLWSDARGYISIKQPAGSEKKLHLEQYEYWDTIVIADGSVLNPVFQLRKKELFITHLQQDNVSGTIIPMEAIHYLETPGISINCFSNLEQKTISRAPQSIFQFSLFPGISTQGKNAATSSNIVSINLLAGTTYNIRAFEIGIVNVNRNLMRGFQSAAISNKTGTQVQGAQVAGVMNRSGGSVTGFQAAGLINFSRYIQSGMQIAGAACIHQGNSYGLQMSGAFNSTGTIHGAQISGLINKSDTLKGFQAGVFNFNKKMSGFNIGIVNVSDTISGVSLGMFNYYRSGRYMSTTISASDLLPLQVSFKVGSRRYYSIYSVMAGYRDVLAYGGGLGRIMTPFTSIAMACELTYHRLVYYADEPALQHNLGEISLMFFRNRGHRFSLAIGPTLNILHYKSLHPASDQLPSYSIATWQSTNSRADLWAGARLSVAYNIW